MKLIIEHGKPNATIEMILNGVNIVSSITKDEVIWKGNVIHKAKNDTLLDSQKNPDYSDEFKSFRFK